MDKVANIGSNSLETTSDRPHRLTRVCMHVLSTARTDGRVMREATALADAGFSVTIVDVEHDRTRQREEDIDGVHFKHIMMASRYKKYYSPQYKEYDSPTQSVPWLLFKAMRMIYGVFAVLTTRADVYHAHDITALPSCWVAAMLRRSALVFDAHELPLVQPHIVQRRVVHGIGVRLLRLMMPRCTATITVSPPLIAEMQHLYGGPAAHVVRNLPVYQQSRGGDRLRQRLGLNAGTRIALYQGGIQASRSLDILVHAARYLDPNIVIVMMGDGPLTNTLERMIAEEGVGDRVKMIPAVPYGELLSWTASADLGLLVERPDYSTSVKFSLPNKTFEYLMAGLPVLTSDMVAVVDTILTYAAGDVIRTLEPEAVAHKIGAMLADRDAWARMHENALAAGRNDLCWEVEKGRIVALYDQILSSRSRRHGATTSRQAKEPQTQLSGRV
jgi:glycosyltransferase involved in cell wall biosynthesis